MAISKAKLRNCWHERKSVNTLKFSLLAMFSCAFPTIAFAEVCDKLRGGTFVAVSGTDVAPLEIGFGANVTWLDYIGDLFFHLISPTPIIAIISILLFVVLRLRVLPYIALATSAFAIIKLAIFVFEKQDNDHQFAMWEGCVLIPYGTFLILTTVFAIASVTLYKVLRSQKSVG